MNEVDEGTNGWTDERMNAWMKWTSERSNEGMNEVMNAWMNDWMHEWMKNMNESRHK